MSFYNKVSFLIFLIVLTMLAACGAQPAPTQSAGDDHTMEHGYEEQSSEDAGHEHDENDTATLVPNNGAVIKIVSPADGAEIKVGTDIVVEVETENFELGADDNHWHVLVDGQSRGMIMGHDFKEVLRGLEPGEHEISTRMSISSHEELEEGDSITITIVE